MNALPGLSGIGLSLPGEFEPVARPADLAPAMEFLATCPDKTVSSNAEDLPLVPEQATKTGQPRRLTLPLAVVSLAVHLMVLGALAAHLAPRPVSTAPVDAIMADIIFELPSTETASDAVTASSAAPGPENAETADSKVMDSMSDQELAALLPPLPDALPPLPETAPLEAAPQEPDFAPPPPDPALAILAVPPVIHSEPASAAVAKPAPVKPAPAKMTEKPEVAARPSAQKPATARFPKAERPVKSSVKTSEPAKARAKPADKIAAKGNAESAKKPSGSNGLAGKDVASSRGAKPAASAAAKSAYGAKLLGHVQRFKRYPAAAQKAGQSGVARLSITIDRNGRLIGSRLSARTGHAILDEEAASVARRAAPYPRMPDGLGATLTFSVALRFAR